MAKYLKLFETSAEYQQFIGGDFLRPNVSLVNDTKSLFYNPLAQEEPGLPYLTITALEDDMTVSFTNSCQYSLNGTDWNELQADEQTPAINTGEKIYFKRPFEPGLGESVGQFTVSKRFNLSGNVMSMLFGDEAEGKTDLTGYNYAFVHLFGSTPVVNVSPDFLPATILADECYQDMFAGCTSLVNAPELPATTLAENCYEMMFFECTSLETAPELPATILATRCYGNMFQDCTSLNYIKMLATDISANKCLIAWVYNVSPIGTFVKSKDAAWDERGESGIPEGWTVETV